MKKFAWSYSTLNAFELCAKKFEAEKITKVVKPGGEASNYGLDVHKRLEMYIRTGQKLPLDMKHLQKHINPLKSAGTPMAETKLALTRNLQPTGFFDNDVWFRCVLDFATILQDRFGLIVDWKTGKQRGNEEEQLKLQAATLLALEPSLEAIEARFFWTKTKEFQNFRWHPAEIIPIWKEIQPRVDRFEKAYNKGRYPATPNFLCEKYCDVSGCQHHGKRAA